MTILLILLMLLPSVSDLQERQGGVKEAAARAAENQQFEDSRKLGEKAIAEARQQVAANPDSPEAHFNLAETILRGPTRPDDDAEIRQEYSRAIELKPDYFEAHYKLGVFYMKMDKHEKAYEELNKAISLRPDFAETYLTLGYAYIQKKFGGGGKLPITEKESTMAIKAFKKAIELKPDFFLAYDGLGEASYYLKQYDEALDGFKRAAAIAPNDVVSHMGIGTIYIELGNKDAAMQEYEAMKRIESESQKSRKEKGPDSFPNLAEGYATVLLERIQKRFSDK